MIRPKTAVVTAACRRQPGDMLRKTLLVTFRNGRLHQLGYQDHDLAQERCQARCQRGAALAWINWQALLTGTFTQTTAWRQRGAATELTIVKDYPAASMSACEGIARTSFGARALG